MSTLTVEGGIDMGKCIVRALTVPMNSVSLIYRHKHAVFLSADLLSYNNLKPAFDRLLSVVNSR